MIHLDNLSPPPPHHLKVCNSKVCKVPLSCKATYSQVLGIREWAFSSIQASTVLMKKQLPFLSMFSVLILFFSLTLIFRSLHSFVHRGRPRICSASQIWKLMCFLKYGGLLAITSSNMFSTQLSFHSFSRIPIQYI